MSRTENCEWCLTPHDPTQSECAEDDTFDLWTTDDNSDEYWKLDALAYKVSTERVGDEERCLDCGNWHSDPECP